MVLFKTVQVKNRYTDFGGIKNVRKIRSNFLRSIFNPIHHFVCLCLDILAVRMAFVRKRSGGNFGWSVLIDSLPKLIFGTLRYSSTLTTSKLCRHKFETSKVKIMVSTRHGDYSTPEKNPPRPLECSTMMRVSSRSRRRRGRHGRG